MCSGTGIHLGFISYSVISHRYSPLAFCVLLFYMKSLNSLVMNRFHNENTEISFICKMLAASDNQVKFCLMNFEINYF